jgi:hypothetical protein
MRSMPRAASARVASILRRILSYRLGYSATKRFPRPRGNIDQKAPRLSATPTVPQGLPHSFLPATWCRSGEG